jgi:L-cysteine desulfidase
MCNPTEHLAVLEVIVLYKRKVIFQQYIPKKHKRFGIQIYKLCDSLVYIYDMSVYSGRQRATAKITHWTVLQVIQRVEGLGHKVFMNNYFTLPALLLSISSAKSLFHFLQNGSNPIILFLLIQIIITLFANHI